MELNGLMDLMKLKKKKNIILKKTNKGGIGVIMSIIVKWFMIISTIIKFIRKLIRPVKTRK